MFREFPEFEPHARAVDGVLVLRFDPGAVREEASFHLDTDNGEITVGLGMYHEHFEWPVHAADEEWSDPIWFIRALLREEKFVVVKQRSGKWSGSTTIGASEPLASIEIAEDETARVISWTGAKDARLGPGNRYPLPPAT